MARGPPTARRRSRFAPRRNTDIYTAMGHGADAYADTLFRGFLVGALRWAAHRE
jgi:hypothetical protein